MKFKIGHVPHQGQWSILTYNYAVTVSKFGVGRRQTRAVVFIFSLSTLTSLNLSLCARWICCSSSFRLPNTVKKDLQALIQNLALGVAKQVLLI